MMTSEHTGTDGTPWHPGPLILPAGVVPFIAFIVPDFRLAQVLALIITRGFLLRRPSRHSARANAEIESEFARASCS